MRDRPCYGLVFGTILATLVTTACKDIACTWHEEQVVKTFLSIQTDWKTWCISIGRLTFGFTIRSASPDQHGRSWGMWLSLSLCRTLVTWSKYRWVFASFKCNGDVAQRFVELSGAFLHLSHWNMVTSLLTSPGNSDQANSAFLSQVFMPKSVKKTCDRCRRLCLKCFWVLVSWRFGLVIYRHSGSFL